MDDITPHDTAPLSIHLQQLVYLREVERAGTFTEAARRLHVSQPALSQSLAELERRVGLPLFEARGRRRELTEVGREAARFASEVLGRTAEFREWVEAYREGGAGSLTVGMIDAASLYALPDAVRRFRRQHPEVRLQLIVDTSTALVERLQRFELDLAFVVAPVAGEFDAVEVGREPLHIYAPADDARAPEEADWVLYPEGSHTRQQIDEGLARLGRKKALGSIDPARMNVNGSSLALGHPFAATGARIVATLAKLLEQKGSGRGLISICTAGGMGVTAILER